MMQEKNHLKVTKTHDFLKEIIASPENFKEDEALLKSLKSQGGIAKYECKERYLEKCSLNTLKTSADELLTGGFSSLDKLRKNAVNAIEFTKKGVKSRKGNTSTSIGQKNRIAEQKKEIEALQRHNLMLTVLLRKTRSRMKILALLKGTDDEKWERYSEYNNEIQAISDHTFGGEI